VRVRFHHLVGPQAGRVQEFDSARIWLGAGRDCPLRLRDPGEVLAHHARVDVRPDGVFLHARGEIRLHGRPVRRIRLWDGDELELGTSTRLRLELIREPGDREVRAGAGRTVLFASVFVALVVAASAALLWVLWPMRAPNAEQQAILDARLAERAFYDQRMDRLRDDLERMESRLTPRDELEESIGAVRRTLALVENSLDERVRGEVERSLDTNPDLAAARAALERLESQRAAAERIIARCGPAVCLIQGSYVFGREAEGEWRFLRNMAPHPDGDADRVPLSLEGKGEVFRVDYTGTGFLVDASGVVLTNRHIAQPWWKSRAAAPLLEQGFEPRFVFLRAYFPGRTNAVEFDLDRTLVDENADLAALRFEPPGDLPPALQPCQDEELVVGNSVLLLGYPSGLDALLARSDEDFARQVEEAPTFDPQAILDELAGRGLVRPLPSRGHLSDLLPDKILFDAPSEVGGSGGPLLDLEGRVIAVNYGILKAYDRANFGVPIRRALDLVERARR
jgi:S1-C subfamily serine protease